MSNECTEKGGKRQLKDILLDIETVSYKIGWFECQNGWRKNEGVADMRRRQDEYHNEIIDLFWSNTNVVESKRKKN